MINDQLKQLSHTLRVFGVHQNFEARCNEAQGKGLSHAEFLRLVLEDEIHYRKERVAKALSTRAKFRSSSDLGDWDETFDRGVSKAKLRELASHTFGDNKENLLLIGKTGAGKSHLSVAIGRRLCADGVSALFMPVNFLFEEVQAARAQGKYLHYIKRITATQVLILDDFGLRNFTHEEACVLVDLLEDRHRKTSVVVSSQADPKGWMKLFEDPVIAEAVVSRLRNPSQQITLTGGHYREKLKVTASGSKKLAKEKMLN